MNLPRQNSGPTVGGEAAVRKVDILGPRRHPKCEEAVIYRAGPRRGELFARDSGEPFLENEHVLLDLGFRCHRPEPRQARLQVSLPERRGLTCNT
jgi:hypothetical protein